MARMSEADVRAALEKCPPDLHRTLIWLCTDVPVDALRSRRDGTA